MLTLAVLLGATPDAALSLVGAVWRANKIVVRDYLPDEWREDVAFQIAAYNASAPPKVPRLVLRDMPGTECGAAKGGIRICLEVGRVVGARAVIVSSRHVIRHATVYMAEGESSSPAQSRRWLLCHELMHALTDIRDAASPLPHMGRSCVHGLESAPGSFDIAHLKRVYHKFDRPRRDGERHHKRHR